MPKHLIFFGTSSFAVPLLNRLAADPRFAVTLVVTQPDRPVGRKQILTPPAVKIAAEALGIPVFQPEKIKAPEALAVLQTHSFDAAVVASYGQILPQAVLDLAPDRFINLHGSLLPAYRGASPITETIKNGEAETGVTVMVMDAAMDHGPMLAKTITPIEPTDTTETLAERLAMSGAASFGDTLAAYLDEKLPAIDQDHARATFCKLIKKEDGLLDPIACTAIELERRVRAYTPWPTAFLTFGERRLKVLECRLSETDDTRAPGTLWRKGEQLLLACAGGTALELVLVRPEGGNTMSGAAYAHGQKIA